MMQVQGAFQHKYLHPLLAPCVRAGVTLGGLGALCTPPPSFHPEGIPDRFRPARCLLRVAEGTPGHVPCAVEVDIQSISTAQTVERSPRTSGGAAAAPAAAAERKRPLKGFHTTPPRHPL